MQETVFVLQKIFLRLLFPVCLTLILCAAAIVAYRRRLLSLMFTAGAFSVLFVASFPVTGLFLLRALEGTEPHYADPGKLASSGVRYVVVLSGGFREGDLSPTDRIGASVLRLLEGIRLYKGIPGCKLVLTGGVIPGLNRSESLARALADAATGMGVPRSAIILENRSWTTRDQARLVGAIVGREPFALVTSAYHMPRSLMLFQAQGLRPVPAPADYLAQSPIFSYETLIPQASGLWMTQVAVKEYLLMLWFDLTHGHR